MRNDYGGIWNLRKTELDLLRICACFFVIVSHLACLVVFDLNFKQWTAANFIYIARDSCVPLFYCISGALYLDHNKSISYKKIGMSSIKYLILYILMGTVFWCFRDISEYAYPKVLLINSFKKSILEPIGHLWFLPSMIGIYLCIPICRQIVKHEKLLNYYLALWLLYNFLKSTILMILDEIKLVKNVNTDIMAGFINTFTAEEFCGYVGYFLLGYWLYHFMRIRYKASILGLIFGLSIIVPAILNALSVRHFKAPLNYVYDYFSIPALLQTICLVLFFKDYVSKIRWKDRTTKFFSLAAAQTFGIYLIHPFFTERLIYKVLDGNILFTIPGFALFIFVICFLIIFVARNMVLNKVKHFFCSVKEWILNENVF